MLNDPVRWAPLPLTPTWKFTTPLPVPAPRSVITNQSALFETAVQAQLARAADTPTKPYPPAASYVWLAVEKAKVQGAASCVTVTDWPPMVMIPVRASPPFAAALNLTTPLPDDDAPPVIAIQAALEAAVQTQSPRVVTVALRSPPADGTTIVVGAIVKVHGAASCVTVTDWPPMVRTPLRAAPPLAAALNRTTPLPDDDAPAVIAIQPTLEAAVHAQSARVVTVALRSPPADGTATVVGAIVNAHGAAACVSEKVCVAMVAVPARPAPGLAAMASCTDPLPVPVAAEAMVIHAALETAVHGQCPAADTVAATVPPLAAIDPPAGVI